MNEAKSLLDGLSSKVAAQVEAEQQEALSKIDARWERLAAMAEFGDLTPEQQSKLKGPFDELKRSIQRQRLVAVMRDLVRRFDERDYVEQLAAMATWSEQARAQKTDAVTGESEGARELCEASVEYVTQTGLPVSFTKAWLASAADVDEYLAALKQAMLDAIASGKRIRI
ncbi:MAG: hypothetical protein H3C34_26275 [Caldilineaceae bacterium]|nr:hypothetical protein [Caldilineaceae bacterium]